MDEESCIGLSAERYHRTTEVVQSSKILDGCADPDSQEGNAPRALPAVVRMRPSAFAGIPSTVFFDYPTELMYCRNDACVEEKLGKRKLRYDTHWERNCIKKAFARAGYMRSTKKWTALWSKHQTEDALRSLNCLQKVNHFPNSWCIGRKDRLLRLVTAMKRLHGAEYDIHPDGYILPGEKDALLRQVQDIDSKSSSRRVREGLWICKPVSSSCGRGIRVLTKEKLLKYLSKDKGKNVIMQRYVGDPYLINGKKFDLRIYVLVTGVDPMRVYVHSQGLTRISTATYSLHDTKDKFAHLTNYSINKDSDKFMEVAINTETGECDDFDENSYKWSLIAFKKYLEMKTSRDVMEATFRRVDELLVKTMIAAESEMTPRVFSDCQYRSNCYELFGCDVMLDSKLRPHLIEVNVSPSLMGTSPLDRQIKGLLVADMFHLVGLYPHDPGMLARFDTQTSSIGSAATRSRTPSAGLRRKSEEGLDSNGSNAKSLPTGNVTTNPFAFNALSRMLAAQDAWRKNPNPHLIDMSVLGATGNEGTMTLLLSIEDEFDRCISTHFTRIHPVTESCERLVTLYRSPRFSDHLLARWLLEKGSKGPLRKLIPKQYFNVVGTQTALVSPSRPTTASAVSLKRGDSVLDDDSDEDSVSEPVFAQRPGTKFGLRNRVEDELVGILRDDADDRDGEENFNDQSDIESTDDSKGGQKVFTISSSVETYSLSEKSPTTILYPENSAQQILPMTTMHKERQNSPKSRNDFTCIESAPHMDTKALEFDRGAIRAIAFPNHTTRPLPPRFPVSRDDKRARSLSGSPNIRRTLERSGAQISEKPPSVTDIPSSIAGGRSAIGIANRPSAPNAMMRRNMISGTGAALTRVVIMKNDGAAVVRTEGGGSAPSRVHPLYSRLPSR